jgi:uncharacterized protein YcbK (DUF882 family)
MLDAAAASKTWLDARLRPLCETLEVIRAFFGKPVHVNSGYRTPAYNGRLKGAASASQHMQGRAADIVIAGVDPYEVYKGVISLFRAGKLPHLGGLGSYPTFTHVDVRPRPADNHVAQWYGGRTSNVAV